MTTIDLHDPDPMNRFYGMDNATAQDVVLRLIKGEKFPEVTLWRLYGYVEIAEMLGAIAERRKVKK